jgi:clathrin heavy chain
VDVSCYVYTYLIHVLQTVTLESDRFVCIREKVKEQKQVVIVDLADSNNVLRRPAAADSAIMHPTGKMLALRGEFELDVLFIHAIGASLFYCRFTYFYVAGGILQIYDVDTKRKIKAHSDDKRIVFWKWVSHTTIGIITDSSVFHWTISDATSAPQHIFDLHSTLCNAQIINYRVTPNGKWQVLVGISGNAESPSESKVKGNMQLYNTARGISQPIEGHAAAFAEIMQDGNQNPTKLFCYAVCTVAGAKVCL